MYRWISGLVVGAVLFAALVSGCGGDSATSAGVTKADFVKQADAVCAKGQKEWKEGLASYEKELLRREAINDSTVQAEVATEQLEAEMLPAVKKQLEGLEGLSVPEGDEAQISKMLTGLSKELAKVESEGLSALAKGHSFEDFEKEAKKYGLSCTLN